MDKKKTTKKKTPVVKAAKHADQFDAFSYMGNLFGGVFGKIFGPDNTDLDSMSKEELKKLVIELRCEKSIGDKISSAISKGLNTQIIGVSQDVKKHTDFKICDIHQTYVDRMDVQEKEFKKTVEDLQKEMDKKIEDMQYAYKVKEEYREHIEGNFCPEYRVCIQYNPNDFARLPREVLEKIHDAIKLSNEKQYIYNKGWNECCKTKKPKERRI